MKKGSKAKKKGQGQEAGRMDWRPGADPGPGFAINRTHWASVAAACIRNHIGGHWEVALDGAMHEVHVLDRKSHVIVANIRATKEPGVLFVEPGGMAAALDFRRVVGGLATCPDIKEMRVSKGKKKFKRPNVDGEAAPEDE